MHQSMTTINVVEDCRYVAERSVDVSVDVDGCRKAADQILKSMKDRNYSTASWSAHPLNPRVSETTSPEAILDWLFTVDLLNFSFWSETDRNDTGRADTQRYAVEYKGSLYTGYWSLVAAINRAVDEGIPITSPSFWISEEFGPELLNSVFASATSEQIPMFKERFSVLVEAGEVMAKYRVNSFASFVKEADQSALKLVEILSARFKSFDDKSVYKQRKVHILKRAQILVADIWACFEGKSYGKFADIDQITMFADYRVPQILHSLKCLRYSNLLTDHLRNLEGIEHGDSREVELRACSIWAVETIRQEILRKDPHAKVNSILIDYYLWDTAKEMQSSGIDTRTIIPCHRTRSIYY